MRTLPALVLGLGIAITATDLHAQVVRGAVTDAASNARLARVVVTLLDDRGRQTVVATTDSAGSFELRAPRSGSYRLQVALLPYVPFTSDRLELAASETVQLTVRLATGAIPLEPVVVVARGMGGRLAEFEKRRARHATGYFLTREEIERRPLARTTTVLLGMPGLTLQPVGRPGSPPDDRNIIQFSGSSGRPCVANVFIDGVPAAQSPATIDERLDVSVLAAVEVYPRGGTAPAEYQRANNCGVVLFWTREAERGGRWSWLHLVVLAAAVVALSVILTR